MYLLRFEQENNINYMVIDAQEEQEKTYDIKMLEKNKIEGLLSMQLRQINNQKMYYYNISSKQQLTQLFRYTSICWEDLKMICDSIAQLVKSVNEYMLDLNNVIVKPEYIYVDISRHSLNFTYCPGNAAKSHRDTGENDFSQTLSDNEFESGLKVLFEYVLERFDHETEKGKLMQVYGLYQNIVQRDYNAENLWKLVCNDDIKSDNQEADIVNCYYDTQNNASGNYVSEGHQGFCEAETFRINDVPCENVGDEEEIVNNSLVNICKFIKVGAFVLAAAGLFRLLLPQFMPIKISAMTAVIYIVCGAAAYLLISKIPKASMTKLMQKTYKQPYEAEIIKTGDEALIREQELADKSSFLDKEVLEYQEAVEKQIFCKEAEPHTMLISDYLKSVRNMSVCLRFVRNENMSEFQGNDLDINKFPCMIGSLADKCAAVIDNELISRVHACITIEEGYYYIEDMNSTNGTYVNGFQVKGTGGQIVNIGDEIMLAGFVYKLERS